MKKIRFQFKILKEDFSLIKIYEVKVIFWEARMLILASGPQALKYIKTHVAKIINSYLITCRKNDFWRLKIIVSF